MRTAWKIALALAVFAFSAPAWASVPKVVMVEDYTATW
jgi:hypothetical protein